MELTIPEGLESFSITTGGGSSKVLSECVLFDTGTAMSGTVASAPQEGQGIPKPSKGLSANVDSVCRKYPPFCPRLFMA